MKVIFIPGFWDAPSKFINVAKLLDAEGIEHKFLDYKQYKRFGNKLNFKIFSDILEDLTDEIDDSAVICYSMGSSFMYDYLKDHNIKPVKLIFVDPLLEKVGNQFVASYKRLLDMHKQMQLVESLINANEDILPLIDVAYLQKEYNKKITFDKKLDLDAIFLWGEKDIICPIENYQKYKDLFNKTELIRVPDQHHNWLVYDDPVKEFLLPQIKL